jgi:transcription elongation factor Elf1
MPRRPVAPVKPASMELVFFYTCPYCQRELPLVSPQQPTMISCDMCRQSFPIVPVDEYSVQFVKLMLADGKAAIDPDYM